MLTEKDLNSLCTTAKRAAIAAGEYIQSQFDQHYQKEQKEGGDSLASQVVTEVDFKAQEIILEHLRDSTNEYDFGLLTEEAPDDSSRLTKDHFWCVDPMDGTLAFTEGRSGYAISIALVSRSGDPIIGVVYLPDLKACYSSLKGEGVNLNDKPFSTQANDKDTIQVYMDQSLQSASYFDWVNKNLQNWANEKEKNLELYVGFGAVRNAIGIMNSSIACYFKFPKIQKGGGCIWDYASTRLFFEELGLIVSDISGQQLYLNNPESTFMNHSGVLFATDSGLFDFIISLGRTMDEL
jgi:3'(2'), 5'-bisphosphate nucleotidase